MHITTATTYIVGDAWIHWLFARLATDQPGLYGVGEGTSNAFTPGRERREAGEHPARREAAGAPADDQGAAPAGQARP